MFRHFLIGLAVLFMLGLAAGCDQPADGPGDAPKPPTAPGQSSEY
jgi:hypothetical protein